MRLNLFGDKANGEPVQVGDEYVEVNVMAPDQAQKLGSIGIRVEKLNDFSDTERVLKSVREGNVIFLKIKGLKEKDIGELKRAVERLKKSIVANNGDIAGVEQDWLILTPEFAQVHRETLGI